MKMRHKSPPLIMILHESAVRAKMKSDCNRTDDVQEVALGFRKVG